MGRPRGWKDQRAQRVRMRTSGGGSRGKTGALAGAQRPAARANAAWQRPGKEFDFSSKRTKKTLRVLSRAVAWP